MMMPPVHRSDPTTTTRSILVLKKTLSPFSSHHPIRLRTVTYTVKKNKGNALRVNAISKFFTRKRKTDQASVEVKAVVGVKITPGGLMSNIGSTTGLADITDLLSRSLQLELVSSEAENGSEGRRIKGYLGNATRGTTDEVTYECSFDVPANFGAVGAIIVKNELRSEIYLNSIVLGNVVIHCNSWVHSEHDQRVFFANKSYLPSETPSGLRKLREQDLESLRGNGEGQRQSFDRIYDYEKYNDLGAPDSGAELARPVLGGPDRPYPRHCRTGGIPSKTDPLTEARGVVKYVPRDEAYRVAQQVAFLTSTLKTVLSARIPSIPTTLVDADLGFQYFNQIDSLSDQGVLLPDLPRFLKTVKDNKEDVLLFDTPETINIDRFSWFKDEEFARQTLAGLNPYRIQLVTEWPLTSKLEPNIYGTLESAITKEIIETEINGVMTLDEAMEKKKLFVLDYHDLLLPYVQKVRELDGTTLYGSRALFLLNEDSTLMPIAIELTRPPIDDKPEWRHVFTPSGDATSSWLWQLAKAHVAAHDACYQNLVVHWLRAHCCTEPYIIASHRQLSEMHPVLKLLRPHFHYTMEINSLARGAVVNAGGDFEGILSLGRYSMEFSSYAYDQIWRFDMEALPADLIRRGMAVEDPTTEHGLKLTIEDYPFASDGLILWDAIKSWVTDYVNHYYPDSKTIESDSELQSWWTEVRTRGHEDKKDEPWWPVLNTADSLIQTLSTIIWITSGHHAAVDFGRYANADYYPGRPASARTNMPNEETYTNFVTNPDVELLNYVPSKVQPGILMAVMNLLSSHEPDEEFLGDRMELSRLENPVIRAAYERFEGKLKEIEGVIDARNADPKLKNRVGLVPYELLKPNFTPGVTAKGVPNSISI